MKNDNAMLRPVIALVLFCAIALPASAANVKTFLLGGQSNMVGIGLLSELPPDFRGAQPRVIIYTAGTSAYPWTTLEPGVGASTGTFGPEVAFGKDISAAFPNETIALVKVAWSGTSLAYDWRPPSAGGTIGPLYTQFVNKVRDALATIPAGNTPVISGMCWMQGESDACNIYPASEYESNLRCLIADLRAEFGVPQMPFVIAMIDRTPTWQEYDVVREAEMNVASSVPYVGIFDTDPFASDGSHYYAAGLVDMGRAFARSMTDLIAPGTTPASVTTPAPTTAPTGTLGDVNGSESVDIVDALLIARHYVGNTPVGFTTANADVNCDGSVTIVDALRVAQYYVGLINAFC
jgi:hypothetical protein